MTEPSGKKLRYLHVYKDRHGETRTYVRRGFRRIAITAAAGTPEFEGQYLAALAEVGGEVANRSAKTERMARNPDRPGQVVYFLRAGNRIKIGTTMKLEARLSEIQTGSPVRVAVALVIPGGFGLERELHDRFRRHRVRGEWFNAHADIVEFIRGERTKSRRIVG